MQKSTAKILIPFITGILFKIDCQQNVEQYVWQDIFEIESGPRICANVIAAQWQQDGIREGGGRESDAIVEVAIGRRNRRRRRRKAISEGSRYATRSQSRGRFASALDDMLRGAGTSSDSFRMAQISSNLGCKIASQISLQMMGGGADERLLRARLLTLAPGY